MTWRYNMPSSYTNVSDFSDTMINQTAVLLCYNDSKIIFRKPSRYVTDNPWHATAEQFSTAQW